MRRRRFRSGLPTWNRIAEREAQVKETRNENDYRRLLRRPEGSKQAVGRHQALMWEVGDLIAQWEALQEHAQEPQGS